MEKNVATLDRNLAAAEENGRQVGLGSNSLQPEGLPRLSVPILSSVHRLEDAMIKTSNLRAFWYPFSAEIEGNCIRYRGFGSLDRRSVSAQPLQLSQRIKRPLPAWITSLQWPELWKEPTPERYALGLFLYLFLQHMQAIPFACTAAQLVKAIGELRGKGMACRIRHLLVLFYINRIRVPSSLFSRTLENDRAVWKVYRSRHLPPVDHGVRVRADRYQIFINLPNGNSLLVWVNDYDSVDTLRTSLASRVGFPAASFYLVHAGKSMQDLSKLSDYQLAKNCSISIQFRLRGGAVGNLRNRGTAGPSSYKDAARSKGPQATTNRTPPQPKGPHASAYPLPTQPGPYIVEKLDDIPALEVKITEVKNLINTLQTHAIICRFNGFWPRSLDLHNWIHTNWTTSCQVLLCSKGFFVVQFESQEDYQKILMQGPWFWGRAGLFITPWFPEFDADNMVVTKMPVWVRLPNLPLPFWHHEVLEDIGNRLGKFIISDEERREQGLFTYARICVEIDLSKGLPDKIQLQHESFKRIQALDYENTAFRCRSCHMTGHLHDSCPHARRFPKKKQGLNPKRKTWQAEYEPSINEESACEESDTEGRQREEEKEEAVPLSETREAKNSDSKKADPKKDGEGPQSTSGNHMADSLPGTGTQTALVIHEEAPTSGVKRGHESEKSDSDKELPIKQKPELVNGREVVIATTSHGRWVEVKNKRKGKKGKIEAYYQP